MFNVGIVGLGSVSPIHIKAINNSSNGKLVAVCDIDKSLEPKFKNINFFTDYKEMEKNMNLDIVHICLPHYLHDSIAMYFAKKGIHIYLEKPISINYKRSYEFMKEINNLTNVKVAVSLQNRLNKTIVKLKKILSIEDKSNIKAIKGLVCWFRPVEYYTKKTWRGILKHAGSGSIINQAIHTLDLMQYINNSVWKSVQSIIGNILDYDIEVEDTAVANFEFSNGAKGLFFSTNAYYGNDSIELQIITERNKYTIKDNKLFKYVNNDFEIICEDEKTNGTKEYYGVGHYKAVQEFYDSIENNTSNYCSLEHAIEVMAMIDAMKISSKFKGKKIYREDFNNAKSKNWCSSNDSKKIF